MHDRDARHPNSALETRLQAIYGLRRGGRLALGFREPYLSLLRKLGDPHKKLPPVVHVAGTNGKGSVIAFMRGILEAEGYKIHTYTSPHLVRFNERIRLAGDLIDDSTLERLLDEVMACNAGEEATFFEVTTALAFHAFSQVPADLVLLETGLGGRLDCTNIIESPEVSVITTISGDHVEFLGPGLCDIAREKAGIIKPGRPCVIGKQTAAGIAAGVGAVFEAQARALGAPVFRCGVEWEAQARAGEATERPEGPGAPDAPDSASGMLFSFNKKEISLPMPGLAGPHQIGNAGAALAALSVMGQDFPVGEAAIRQGLVSVEWPGRLQKITSGPWADRLPPGFELWIDGGHNDSAGEALAAQARLWAERDARPLHIIVGMMGSKHPEEFLLPILPFARTLSAVPIPGEPGCQPPQAILAAAQQAGGQAALRDMTMRTFPDIAQALQALQAFPPGRVLITGSLYLVGSVLS